MKYSNLEFRTYQLRAIRKFTPGWVLKRKYSIFSTRSILNSDCNVVYARAHKVSYDLTPHNLEKFCDFSIAPSNIQTFGKEILILAPSRILFTLYPRFVPLSSANFSHSISQIAIDACSTHFKNLQNNNKRNNGYISLIDLLLSLFVNN